MLNRFDYNSLRQPAEFEPQEAVVLFWPVVKEPIRNYNVHAVFADIIANLIDQVQVYVNCGFSSMMDECKSALISRGVDVDRIIFSCFPDATNWARDYGPDIVLDKDGNTCLVNFRFNMYGQSDPEFEKSRLGYNMGPHMGILLGCRNFICPDLFSEGGDREFNGNGVLMTIKDTEVNKRNPNMAIDEVETILKDSFNLKKIIWLPYPTYDDESILFGVLETVNGIPVYRSASANGHIDEMARFIDKKTVLLAEVTNEDAKNSEAMMKNKKRLDEAYEVLKSTILPDGTPLTVKRIPIPDPIYVTSSPGDWLHDTWGIRFSDDNFEEYLNDGSPLPDLKQSMKLAPALSYCNFLICNNVVLSQCYWQKGMPESIKKKDEEALRILQESFPERKVIPINTLALNIMGGGIHCVTKNIPYKELDKQSNCSV